jgi:2-polyprenyl-6-methoxyphenol hydroxylase-like FAD-dependent oxidoreductase
MTTRTALISGAGIAGATAAFWLQRAGYDVTVVERARSARKGGQTVDLRGAGRDVARRMGVYDEVVARSVHQRGIANVDDAGTIRATMGVEAFGGNGIISEVEILRGDLADVLLEAVQDRIQIIWDDSVTAIADGPTGVTVEFERSRAARFDLVVGADGSHSTVRRLAFGPESEFVRPLGAYQAWFTTQDTPDLDNWYQMFRAPGGLVASLRPGRLPGEAKASLCFRADPGTDPGIDRRDTDAVRRLMRQRFAGITGWKVPWLLDALDTAPDVTFDSMDQVRMDSWTRGRVALIGDAACAPGAVTGMGTSLALVGAYVLAGDLQRAGGDHTAAFRGYEQIMRPYVDQAQELPPGGIGGYAPRSRVMIGLGNLSLRSMTRWPMRPLLEKQFSKADAIELPDYSTVA